MLILGMLGLGTPSASRFRPFSHHFSARREVREKGNALFFQLAEGKLEQCSKQRPWVEILGALGKTLHNFQKHLGNGFRVCLCAHLGSKVFVRVFLGMVRVTPKSIVGS